VYLEQYDRIMIELLNEEGSSSSINALPSLLSPQREEVEAESDSSLSPIITTSPLPPLPPRVSRRDPRLTLKEYNSNNTSHQSPTNIK
jgi:hypothetical protein